jgi:hypothetical protein
VSHDEDVNAERVAVTVLVGAVAAVLPSRSGAPAGPSCAAASAAATRVRGSWAGARGQITADRVEAPFVTRAMRHELEREQLGAFVAELDEELGAVSKKSLAEARAAWLGR